MNDAEKLKLCQGCRDNFYNDNNPHGIKRCWCFEKAEVVTRFRLGWWTAPTVPGAFREVVTLKCHNAPGQYVHYEKPPTVAVEPKRLEANHPLTPAPA